MKIKDEYTKLVAPREKKEEIVDWDSEPVIVATIDLKSTIPPELKLKNLRGGIPTSWEEQRMLYGFTKP